MKVNEITEKFDEERKNLHHKKFNFNSETSEENKNESLITYSKKILPNKNNYEIKNKIIISSVIEENKSKLNLLSTNYLKINTEENINNKIHETNNNYNITITDDKNSIGFSKIRRVIKGVPTKSKQSEKIIKFKKELINK